MNFFYKFLLLYSIIYLILPLKLEITKIVYPPESSEPIFYYEELFKNRMAVNMTIGIPNQNVTLLLRSLMEVFYIISNNTSNNTVRHYNEKISQTKRINYKLSSMLLKEYSIGYRAQEYFNFDNKNTMLDFVFTNSTFDEATKLDGCLGLGLISSKFNNESQVNYIQNLKERNLINSYEYRIDLINDTNGYLIIDEKIDNDYELKNISCTNIFGVLKFGIDIDSSMFHGISLGVTKMLVDLSQTYFSYYYTSSNLLRQIFIPYELKKICRYSLGNNTQYEICNASIFNYDLSFKFYNKILNYTFEFSTREMFMELPNNEYIFLIRATTEEIRVMNILRVGSYFLKKYKMSFNQDRKMNSFLIKKQKSSNNVNVILIVIIVLIIIVIAVLIFVIYKLLNNKKNKKHNYLDDDYEYKIVEN